MFVRRLVTGVRSSCEASATSWRCAWTEASSALIECSSASSIALKLVARRPISSSPTGSIRPLRSCVSATCSVGLGEALQRQHGGAGHQPPEQRRERDAADVEQRQDQAQAAAAGCRLRSAAGRTGRRARSRALGEDAQVRRRRRARRGRSACRRRAASARVRASTGSETFARGADEDRARGADHLLVAAHLVGSRRQVAEAGCRRPAPVAGALRRRPAPTSSRCVEPGPVRAARAAATLTRRSGRSRDERAGCRPRLRSWESTWLCSWWEVSR